MDRKTDKHPNRAIIFHPKRRPRILEGQLHKSLIRKDLRAYNTHLYKLFTATPLVDDNPPYLNPYNYVNLKKLRVDCDRLEQIDRENKMLIAKINAINRSKPTVDCWNSYSIPNSPARMAHNLKCKQTMMENICLLGYINKATSNYSRKIMKKRWKVVTAVFEDRIHLKKVFHMEKSLDQLISKEPSLTTGLAMKFVIPKKKAFLDFQIKEGLRLGQIVVELYHEHAPKIVRNFLAHCNEARSFSYKNCRIHYGEKGRYFAAGDVTMQNGKGGHSIFGGNFDSTPNDLKHTRQGVLVALPICEPDKFDRKLSIRQRIKKPAPKPMYNSQFAITVCPHAYCDGKAIIFGKIVKGNSVVRKINDMLKKCGTPLVPIIISRCGKIPYTKAEHDEWKIAKFNMLQEGIIFDDESLAGEEQEEEK